ncbi:hypothetical protein [Streptomyces sp. 147326]
MGRPGRQVDRLPFAGGVAIGYTIEVPDGVDVSEIVVRPTVQA